MKRLFFTVITVIAVKTLSAQIISGTIQDKNSMPIEYVTVTLKTVNDSIISGDITNVQGKFNIPYTVSGKYKLNISLVGYEFVLQEIIVNGDVELPVIQMNEGLELDEVVISAHRKLLAYERGKINLAVENSRLSNLPATTDILSFVPGVNVQGNEVSVIGKGKPLIFINGKEVKSMNQIQSLQPETIKNITLDRNPSAKYDAAYNSVIHINVRRNLKENFSAQYIQGGTAGHNFNHSETFNLNHVSGKFGNFLSYKFKNSKNTESANTYQHILLDNAMQTNSYEATMHDSNNDNSLTFGSNMKLNEKNTVDIQYFFNHKNQTAGVTGQESLKRIEINSFDVNRNGNESKQNHTFNLAYVLTIDSIRSLQFFGDYTYLKNASVERVISEEQISNSIYRDTLDNRSIFDAYSLRSEYNAELFSDYNLTFGAKYSLIKSRAQSEMNGDSDAGLFNNQSALTETNLAAYTIISRQFNSVYTELGLRAEFTHDKYYKNQTAIFTKPRNSSNLFPSFMSNYAVSKKLQLNFNYTSKIQRSSFNDIDPTFSYLSSTLYTQGNPELNPMIEHNIEINAVVKQKLNISIAYKILKNMMAYTIEPSVNNENILLNRPVNIPKSSSVDLTANYTVSIGSLTSNLTGNFYLPFVEYPYNGTTETNIIPMYQLVAINQYPISPALFLFCNFAFQSKHSYVNTVISPTYNLTAGINWVLMQGKIILTIFGNDLLHKSQPEITSRYGKVTFGQNVNPDTRMIGVILKCNFNKFRNIFKKSESNQQDVERIMK
jgi:hypothetical protein